MLMKSKFLLSVYLSSGCVENMIQLPTVHFEPIESSDIHSNTDDTF